MGVGGVMFDRKKCHWGEGKEEARFILLYRQKIFQFSAVRCIVNLLCQNKRK